MLAFYKKKKRFYYFKHLGKIIKTCGLNLHKVCYRNNFILKYLQILTKKLSVFVNQ